MTPYWISLALSVGLMLVAQKRADVGIRFTKKVWSARDGRVYARWGVVASAAVFIALTGFRYGVGQDYFYTYVPYFNRVCLGMGPDGMELGFFAINWLVSQFTTDPAAMFVICSILFFGFTYAAIMKESSHPVLSVFLLFGMSYLFIFMNAMRQMTAIAILLFSIRYIEDRKMVPFLLCILAAWSLHSSSIVFLVAYWLPRMKINIPLCAALVFLFFAFRSQIADLLNFFAMKTQYAGYVGSRFDDGETGTVVLAMNVVVLAFSAIAPRLSGKEYDERYRLLLWCQLICTLVSILSGFIPLSQRLRWVFSLSSILLLPLAIDSVSDKHLRFVIQAIIVVLYIAYIAITIGTMNGNNVVPYQSIFFNGVA